MKTLPFALAEQRVKKMTRKQLENFALDIVYHLYGSTNSRKQMRLFAEKEWTGDTIEDVAGSVDHFQLHPDFLK